MSFPTHPPAEPRFAPQLIILPPEVNEAFQKLLQNSMSGNMNGQKVEVEWGGTLIKDRITGALSITNKHSGGSGAMIPDRNILQKGVDLVGTFHTHPYLSGATAAFDSADVENFINSGDLVTMIQSGIRQFMYMRTRQTPKHIIQPASYDAARKKLLSLHIVEGPDSFFRASQLEAKAFANKFYLAYYEGQDGNFARVIPALR